MNSAVFFAIIIAWCLLHVYLYKRLKAGLRSTRWIWALRSLCALSALSHPLFFVLRRTTWFPASLAPWVIMSLCVVTMFLFLMIARDLALALPLRIIDAFRKDEPDPSRRAFFLHATNLSALGLTGALTGWGVREALKTPSVEEVELPIEGLHPDLDGYRIVQLSDIHVGPSIRSAEVREIVRVANTLSADLVAITGDLVDGFVPDLRDDVAPLAELESRDGTFYCTGNHEYYWDGPGWIAEAARLGMKPLNNAHEIVHRGDATLLVAGCADISQQRGPDKSDPIAARAGAPECDFSILLAHQPKSIYQAVEAGYDLQLSGHTHGGQFFPISLFVGLAHPFVRGLGKHEDTHIYVNRGTGYWGTPLRTGVPSEITLLRLVHA